VGSQDLRRTFRNLARKPLFTAMVVLMLTLGLGTTTAIFTIVSGVLLRPLPVRDPERLVAFWENNPQMGWEQSPVAAANYLDWAEQGRSFEGIAAYSGGGSDYLLSDSANPEIVRGQLATANFFDVLGVAPAAGRSFRPEETWKGEQSVVILSDAFWHRRFAADLGIIGKPIRINSETCIVVGVMPPGFSFPEPDLDFWRPFEWDPADREHAQFRRAHMLQAIGRIKPGVSFAEAEAELRVIAQRLEQRYPDTNEQMGAGLTPLMEWMTDSTRKPLLLMMAAALLVLLITYANAGNLILVRTIGQLREIAVRSALGAKRGHLVRQVLAESFVLSLVSGLLALLLAYWVLRVLVAFAPEDIPRLATVSIDEYILGFLGALTVVTALILGIVPAILGSRPNPGRLLQDSFRGTTAGVGSGRIRKALAVAEVALAVLLVTGAGLLIKSFSLLIAVDPGFRPEKLLRVQISLPSVAYSEPAAWQQFYDRLLDQVRALPGVESAAEASRLPVIGGKWTSEFAIQGRAEQDRGMEVRHLEITPGYLKTMGISLLAGRDLTAEDRADGPPVVLINETLAHRLSDRPPLGRLITFEAEPGPDSEWYTIVGIAKDTKQFGLDSEVMPEVYKCSAQVPKRVMNLMVRTKADPLELVGAVRNSVRSLDPELALMKVASMEEAVADTVASQRFLMMLFAFFGCVSLILAATGIYSVMAYSVSQRTPEIGIRMAMGANREQISGLVLRQAGVLVLLGAVLGVSGYIALSRHLTSLLFGITTVDPAVVAGVPVLLISVGLLACYLPARRAARVDPLIAMRSE